MYKTDKMKVVEMTFETPLEDLLEKLWPIHRTVAGVAKELGIAPTTLYSWLPILGFEIEQHLVKAKHHASE